MTDGPSVLLVVIPFMGALLSLGDSFRNGKVLSRTAGIFSFLSSLVLLAFLYPEIHSGGTLRYPVGGWPPGVGIMLVLDRQAWFVCLLVTVVCLAGFLFSWGEGAYDFKFTFFYLIMAGGMQGTILTEDVFNLFVFLEIIGVTSYMLIAYGGKGTSILASFRYLMYSSVGMMFYLFGVFIIYRAAGTLSFSEILAAAQRGPPAFTEIRLGVLILMAGLGIRVAIAPFHFWLPDAHAAAPHPVSAVLSGVMLKASIIPVFRLWELFRQPSFFSLLLWTGAATAIIGSIYSLAQKEAKRLLAWSSVSQMGYVFAAFGAAGFLSVESALLHALNHGIAKSLLFLSLGVIIHRTGRKRIGELRGLGFRQPLAAAGFWVGALSLIGVPPFGGFIGKKSVAAALYAEPAVYLILAAAGFFAAAAMFKLSAVFLPVRRDVPVTVNREKNPCMTLSLAVILLASAAAVFLPVIILPENLPSAYTTANLTEAGIVLLAGIVILLLSRTRTGSRGAEFLLRLHPGQNGLLVWSMLGFAGLVGFHLLY